MITAFPYRAPANGASPQRREAASALIISPYQNDHACLRAILGAEWDLHSAVNGRQALVFLWRTEVPVVICERTLPDGSWKEILDEVLGFPNPPALIVASRTADEQLWSAVLALGGFDVFAKPFHRGEVQRVTGLAAAYWEVSRVGLSERRARLLVAFADNSRTARSARPVLDRMRAHSDL